MTTKISSGPAPQLPVDRLSHLSLDLISVVCSCMCEQSMQAATSVSKGITNNVIRASNTNEYISISEFVNFLINFLSENKPNEMVPHQKKLLEKILKILPYNGPTKNLLQLKEYVLKIEKQLINVLRTWDLEAINKLIELSSESLMRCKLPRFMENIFEQAKVCKKIDTFNLTPIGAVTSELWAREIEFYTLFGDLTQVGSIDQAIAIAIEIDRSESIKNNVFLRIATIATEPEQEDIDNAIKAARYISNEQQKNGLLINIAKNLIPRGNIEGSIKAVKSINDEDIQDNILTTIAKDLIQRRDIKGAIHITKHINSELIERGFLIEAAEGLAERGDIDSAIEFIKNINSPSVENGVLKEIAKNLAKSGNIEGSIKAVKSINDEDIQDKTLTAIAKDLIERRDIKGAIHTTKHINSEPIARGFLIEAAEGLAERGDIDSAIEFIKNINSQSVENFVLKEIAENLAKSGNIDAATKVEKVLMNRKKEMGFL